MDQFDVVREMDAAAGEDADAALERLEADKEKTRARDRRLVRLDVGHYFDPKDGWVLAKQGSQYRRLTCDRLGSALAESKVEAEAAARGFRRVKDGLHWNESTCQLYVKSEAGYALFSIQALPEAP
jgi:hypothetical protein